MLSEERRIARSAVVATVRRCRGNVHVAARQLHKPVAYVLKWWNRYKLTGKVDDLKRKGRPRIFTAAAIEHARKLLLQKQSASHVTAELASANMIPANTHRTTTLRAVKRGADGLQCVPEQITPAISEQTEQNRLAFAEQHEQAGTDWSKLMALDSCMFRIHKVGGCRRVWSIKGSRPVRALPHKLQQVHVYGGIMALGKTRLVMVTGTTGLRSKYKVDGKPAKGVISLEYQDVMGDALVPDAEAMFSAVEVTDWAVLQDRAPVHSSASSKAWLAARGVKVLEGWPGCSPDLNPIEHVWGWMKARIYRQGVTTLQQLKDAVQAAWDAVPETMCSDLMHSMPRRLQRVIAKKGAYIGM
jgi:DDE superfamily endonuclease